jgi:hypothetical protein
MRKTNSEHGTLQTVRLGIQDAAEGNAKTYRGMAALVDDVES